MSTEFYTKVRLVEADFINGLTDKVPGLTTELVKRYKSPEFRDGRSGEVEVSNYRFGSPDGNFLWAYFTQRSDETEATLSHFERFGRNKVTAILETLAKAFDLDIVDELGFDLADPVFREING